MTFAESDALYEQLDVWPDYLFTLSESEEEKLLVDAQNSSHYSRFFNHHQNGSLAVQVSAAERRIDFFTSRHVQVGEVSHAVPWR